jgi:hypothetical protein
MLSSGLGASVLAFFGERGPVVVGRGGGSEWSGTGRLSEGHLGAWRSARAGLGGLLGDRPLGVVHLRYQGGVGSLIGCSFGAFSLGGWEPGGGF